MTKRKWWLSGLAGVLVALVLILAVGSRLRAEPAPAVIIAAGDIAGCKSPGREATAALVEQIPGTVLTLGDNVYPAGAKSDYTNCYNPTWGRFKDRTKPAPGNHDYLAADARPYYDYFGMAAGTRGQGYYSFDLGSWHIISLNSDCKPIGGCQVGSPEEQWLKADLAAHPAQCTLAYWHHPIFGSTGGHTDNKYMLPIWNDLYEAGADIVLNGHAHNYERLAPIDPQGNADPQKGIREFVVGTGGRDHQLFAKKIFPASEVRNDDTFGVLKLTLRAGGYDWQFVPEAGKTFTDAGSGECH
jgi:acid phosphatase type 7